MNIVVLLRLPAGVYQITQAALIDKIIRQPVVLCKSRVDMNMPLEALISYI